MSYKSKRNFKKSKARHAEHLRKSNPLILHVKVKIDPHQVLLQACQAEALAIKLAKARSERLAKMYPGKSTEALRDHTKRPDYKLSPEAEWIKTHGWSGKQ
jgi:hypothetical protein